MTQRTHLLHSLSLSLVAALGLVWTGCSQPQNTDSDSSIKIVDNSLVGTDLLANGTYDVSEYDYDSGALIDHDVLPGSSSFGRPDVKTDIRGRLYLPSGTGPFPVVVFLHGNHGTCGLASGEGNPRLDISVEFTLSGRCPSGYVESPSHLGYAESAKQLASWGYAVLSVNANRGITGRNGYSDSDIALIYARGALVLRHLEEFYKWSQAGKTPDLKLPDLDLTGKFDFANVGLMGHSRGGEGMRYAYNIYNDTVNTKWKTRIPDLKIKGVFEIGPVDMGTSAGKVEARGTAWTVLIPGCDSDVYDFSGVNPYSRMLAAQADGLPKSVFTLWGANHNFFNSEWQVSDAPHSCIGSQAPLWDTQAPALPAPYSRYDAQARAGLTGSDAQINTAKGLMYAFFSAHLSSGANSKLSHVFDPQYRLPEQLSGLGPSSREYLDGNGSKLILDAATSSATGNEKLTVKSLKDYIATQIDTLSKDWTAYAAAKGMGKYKATLYSNTLSRSALVIEGSADSESKELTLPFQSVQKTDGYWTIDLSLAFRKECYSFDLSLVPDCPAYTLSDDFEVALVLADGTETKSVRIREYVQLQNWYNQMLSKAGNQWAGGFTEVVYEYIPVLFQTARFELSDFDAENASISGVKLVFPPQTDVALVLEAIRLNKRP